MSPTSDYLKRPIRSEEEARTELRKKCERCAGRGHYIERDYEFLTQREVPCPICNKDDRHG